MKDAHFSHTPKQNERSFVKQLAYLLQKRGFKLVVTDSYGTDGTYHGPRYSFKAATPPTELTMDNIFELLPAELVESAS